MLPTGHGVCTVADVGRRIGCPALVGDDVFTNREIGREREELIPVCNRVVKGYLQRFCIQRLHIQVALVVTVNDLKHVTVVCAEFFGRCTLPCEFKVVCGDVFTVGPFETVTQRIRVGHGAVRILNALHQFGGSIGNDDQLAAVVLRPLCKAGEQMRNQRCAVDRGVQRRVDRVGLRGKADSDAGFCGFFLLAGAGGQRKHHCQDQEQCKDFLHFSNSFLFFFYQNVRQDCRTL